MAETRDEILEKLRERERTAQHAVRLAAEALAIAKAVHEAAETAVWDAEEIIRRAAAPTPTETPADG